MANPLSVYRWPAKNGASHYNRNVCSLEHIPVFWQLKSCIYIYIYMGIVWLRALCNVWELVIGFIEVVHVCKILCTFHRSCARFTRPPNNVRVQLLWNGRLSLGALNQTIPIYVHIYIYYSWFPIRLLCLWLMMSMISQLFIVNQKKYRQY